MTRENFMEQLAVRLAAAPNSNFQAAMPSVAKANVIAVLMESVLILQEENDWLLYEIKLLKAKK